LAKFNAQHYECKRGSIINSPLSFALKLKLLAQRQQGARRAFKAEPLERTAKAIRKLTVFVQIDRVASSDLAATFDHRGRALSFFCFCVILNTQRPDGTSLFWLSSPGKNGGGGMTGSLRAALLVLIIFVILFLAGVLAWLYFCNCRPFAGGKLVSIVLEEAAVSVWDDKVTVGAQLQLKNNGNGTANDLRVTRVEVDGGNYQGPVGLPISLGDLAAGGDVRFDAVLHLAVADGSPHILNVEGNYRDGLLRPSFRTARTISPNAAPPGPVPSVPGEAVKQNPNSAPYPPSPPKAPFGPNAESPIFVPLGPPRQLFPPTPSGTSLGTSAGGASVQIPVNTTMRSAGVPPDPNAAAATANGVVLATYNTGISFSINGGQNFTDIPLLSPQPGNPGRTSFFPQSDGGLCCDQVVIYLANQNLFVWLMQYNPVTFCATNCPPQPPPAPPATFAINQSPRLRVAWTTPEAAAADFWNAWTYIDLTGVKLAGVSDGLGINNNEWLDYPDMAWSNTFVYVGIDHGFTIPGKVYTGRRIVARLSLADMGNPAVATVHYDYAELTGSNGLNKTHFVQDAAGRMVVGSLDNSSTMRVFTWKDGESSIPSPATVGISSIQQGNTYTSTAPDGTDWLAVSFPGNITGAAYRSVGGIPSRDEYLFAFDAGANAPGRPRAYVRLETLVPNGDNYSAFAEYDIWNNDYAFAMAA